MPSEAAPAAPGPDASVGRLLGRARPFRYRGAVHRLLGVPVSDAGELASPPRLPLPAFRYHFPGPGLVASEAPGSGAPDRGRGDPPARPTPAAGGSTEVDAADRPRPSADPTSGSLRPAARSRSPDPARTLPAGRGAPSPPRPAAHDPPGDPEPGPSAPSRPGEHATGRAGPSGEASRGGQPAPREAPRPTEGSVGLAVPGLTERRAFFAALAGLDLKGTDVEPPPASTADAPARSSASADERGTEREGPEPAPSGGTPVTDGTAPARLRDTATKVRGEGAGKEKAARGLTAFEDAADRPPAALVPRGPAALERREVPSPEGPPGDARTAAFRARVRPGREVEHLRRAVTKLAGRRSAPPAEGESGDANAGTVPRASDPERKVVVVRRRPPSPRRVPRAFWSSSILRSTHLRLLR